MNSKNKEAIKNLIRLDNGDVDLNKTKLTEEEQKRMLVDIEMLKGFFVNLIYHNNVTFDYIRSTIDAFYALLATYNVFLYCCLDDRFPDERYKEDFNTAHSSFIKLLSDLSRIR
jgi:hypothetical protein